MKITSQNPENIRIIFLAICFDYFSNKKPGVYFYIKDYQGDISSLSTIEKAYNDHLSESISQQTKVS
jgi:hypothetical protein